MTMMIDCFRESLRGSFCMIDNLILVISAEYFFLSLITYLNCSVIDTE